MLFAFLDGHVRLVGVGAILQRAVWWVGQGWDYHSEEEEADWLTVEDLVLEREEVRRVHEALAQLPFHLRLPVVLRFFEGLSCAQIAQEMDCSETTVRKRLTIALRHLSELLRDRFPWHRGEER